MKKRGVEWTFIGPVDNPLVQMIDEVAIGFAEDKNYDRHQDYKKFCEDKGEDLEKLAAFQTLYE